MDGQLNNNEEWAQIDELKGLYLVSNFGRVKRKPRDVVGGTHKTRKLRGRICNTQDNGNGYKQIYVSINNERIMGYVHRLVAKHFIDNPQNKRFVNHKDLDKSNNNADNLEWCTVSENARHANINGAIKKGEDKGNSKLTTKQVLAIKRLFRINPKFNRSAIGRKLGVRDSTIIKIIKGQRWAHIK